MPQGQWKSLTESGYRFLDSTSFAQPGVDRCEQNNGRSYNLEVQLDVGAHEYVFAVEKGAFVRHWTVSIFIIRKSL